jgi:hypothetical protein
MAKNHTEIELSPPLIRVDGHIAPVVEWLNRLSFVSTLSCCEGEDRAKPSVKPHVVFFFWRTQELDRIACMVEDLASLTIEEAKIARLDFHDETCRDDFIRYRLRVLKP